MKHKVSIKGTLVPTSYKWYYDWYGMETTCPRDVKKILDNVQQGDEVEVYVNSPGGAIDTGSEIYTMLREITEICDVKIIIVGQAHSAASVVACAAYNIMSPTALMMVHCTSVGGVSGNHNTMERAAEMLTTADNALCTAYMAKTGMSREEALEMMEHETWLTAEQAKEKGLVDEIMFEEEKEGTLLVAGPFFDLPSEAQMERAKTLMENESNIINHAIELCKMELAGLEKKKRR